MVFISLVCRLTLTKQQVDLKLRLFCQRTAELELSTTSHGLHQHIEFVTQSTTPNQARYWTLSWDGFVK